MLSDHGGGENVLFPESEGAISIRTKCLLNDATFVVLGAAKIVKHAKNQSNPKETSVHA